jgi:hypothetical protein
MSELNAFSWQLFAMFMVLSTALVFDSRADSSTVQTTFITWILIAWFIVCCSLSIFSLTFGLRAMAQTARADDQAVNTQMQVLESALQQTTGRYSLSRNPLHHASFSGADHAGNIQPSGGPTKVGIEPICADQLNVVQTINTKPRNN